MTVSGPHLVAATVTATLLVHCPGAAVFDGVLQTMEADQGRDSMHQTLLLVSAALCLALPLQMVFSRGRAAH